VKPPVVLLLGAWDPSCHAGIAWVDQIVRARQPHCQVITLPTALTLQLDTEFCGYYPASEEYVRAAGGFLALLPVVDYCYIGWLADAGLAATIANWLACYPTPIVVMDPVARATRQSQPLSGADWLNASRLLVPRAHWLLPNREEWQALSRAGVSPAPSCRVWVTGGGEAADRLWCQGQEIASHNRPRQAFDPHGSGCTLGGLLVASLAAGDADPFTQVSSELDRLWTSSAPDQFRTRAVHREAVQ